MNLEEAFAHALNGDAILFLGSGFSVGATNVKGTSIKRAPELTTLLATQSHAPAGATLEDAAELFQRKFGTSALMEELVKEFTATHVAPHHKSLAETPWVRVYTTNYDNVFELAAEETGKPVQSITAETDPFSLDGKQQSCIHLNGYIKSITPEFLGSTFKLTETSYVTASIENSPWATRLREDLRIAQAAFFVGYGLYDLDVRRILAEAVHLKTKCFFAVGADPSDLLKQRIDRFGSTVALDVEKLGNRLTQFRYTYKVPDRRPLFLKSLVEVLPVRALRKPSDQDILDLFEFGTINESAIAASISNSAPYYLQRSKLGKTIELVEGGAPVVVLTSTLGNGKTLFLKELEVRMQERGYRVFRASSKTDGAALEFERIAQDDTKTLIVVDNYQHWIPEIRAFRQVRSDKNRLVLTARDSTHDVLYDRLELETGLTSIPEISLNRLTESEIDWFVTTLEHYGLWKTFAGKSVLQKKKQLNENYSGQIHGILLGLLESQDIGRRARSVMDEALVDRGYFEIISSIFIFNILNYPPTVDLLYDLWGTETLSSSAFRENVGVRQLIDFYGWEVRAKSSVVAEFLLRESKTSDLVSILSKLARHIADAAKAVSGYLNLFNEITRFSSVQRILPEGGRLEGTIQFYESVKDINLARRSPLFWLQYAVGCLVGDDLRRAKFYFDTAYALAEKLEFNPFQIDNHFARYLLVESAKINLPVSSAVQNFREARAIISRQLTQNERRHYPFKVACAYQNFVDKYGPKLDAGICKEVIGAAEFVVEKIDQLPEDRARHAAVFRCKEAMSYVIQRCKELESRIIQKPNG